MERTKILSYCKICLNRQNSLKKGIICSLTDNVGSFEEDCSSFILDKIEVEKKKRNIKQVLENEYGNFNEYKSNNKNTLKKSLKIYESKFHFHFGIVFSIILFGILLYEVLILKKTISDFLAPSIFGLLIFSFSIYSLSKIKKTPILEVNESHMEYKGLKIYSNDILLFGTASDIDNPSQKFLILGTTTKNIIKIRLEELKIEQTKLISTIQLMRNNVA